MPIIDDLDLRGHRLTAILSGAHHKSDVLATLYAKARRVETDSSDAL
ncbi:hypothetical protein [Mesorhizobium sp.]|nr:hypothetical protein [Mesorhizobium sp.]